MGNNENPPGIYSTFSRASGLRPSPPFPGLVQKYRAKKGKVVMRKSEIVRRYLAVLALNYQFPGRNVDNTSPLLDFEAHELLI